MSKIQILIVLKRLCTFQGPTPPGAGSTELSDTKYAWLTEFYHCSGQRKKLINQHITKCFPDNFEIIYFTGITCWWIINNRCTLAWYWFQLLKPSWLFPLSNVKKKWNSKIYHCEFQNFLHTTLSFLCDVIESLVFHTRKVMYSKYVQSRKMSKLLKMSEFTIYRRKMRKICILLQSGHHWFWVIPDSRHIIKMP